MDYQLIALDIDGTLLNSRKEIPPEAAQAVRTVVAAGKTVAFATGRAVSELPDLTSRLPEVRYAVCASGACLYDIWENKAFGLQPVPAARVKEILAVAHTKDTMPQLVLPYLDIIQASHMENLEHFNMGVYRPLYEHAMTLVPDIWAFAETSDEPVLKVNIYHAQVPDRIVTRAQLESPDLELVYSEVSSVECSPAGVNKGTGLQRLCGLLGIPAEACIAVGDAENDIPMLRIAGLGVAMGNATDNVKNAADLVVSDLDHGGCAEAIRLLLNTN